jgi:hypothetical protein
VVAVIAAIAPVAAAQFLAPPLWMAHADPTTPGPPPGGYLSPDDMDCPNAKAAQAAHPQPIWEPGCRAEKNNRCILDSRCHVPGMPYPQSPARPTQPAVRTPAVGGSPPANAPAAEPAVLPPPKSMEAPPNAIEAAKKAPPTTVDPANPPAPPKPENFLQRVQDLIAKRHPNVDVVNANGQALARPRHWGFLDNDTYHRPLLFNPMSEATTFRYFYSGAYREVYVAAGASVVLNVAVVGVFPFTAVSESYVSSGSFNGGAWIPPQGWTGPPPPDYTPPPAPAVYTDVKATIPATNQTVEVGKVQVVGRDPNQPPGSQDTFMLDDSTLAWGQATDPRNGGQINVAKTQSLPGVGPIDNGGFLTALAAQPEPTHSPWPWVVGGVVAVLAVGPVLLMVLRRRRAGADARSD